MQVATYLLKVLQAKAGSQAAALLHAGPKRWLSLQDSLARSKWEHQGGSAVPILSLS